MAEQENKMQGYELGVPQESLEQFARAVFPLIQAYYETEEGKADFVRWKEEKEH